MNKQINQSINKYINQTNTIDKYLSMDKSISLGK